MYGKKVSFTARGDSELNWDVNPCKCQDCCVLDDIIYDVRIHAECRIDEHTRSILLTSLLEKLGAKGESGARVEITRGSCKSVDNLLFVHINPSKRDEECKRSGYYFFDFLRSDENVYTCKNALKRPRKSRAKSGEKVVKK